MAFLSSVDNNGYPNTKAMLPPRKIDGLKTIYFSTNTSSMRVAQFKDNPKASLYFIDRKIFSGILLLGNIKVLEDKETKEEIWQEGDEMYYSKGVTDPDYCVLKFTVIKGRYYSNFKSKDFTIA